MIRDYLDPTHLVETKIFIISEPYLDGKKLVLIYPYLRDRPIGIKNIPLPKDI
jgi:hypothetical protein